MTEYSEPDAYARQGMGIAMLGASIFIGLEAWVFPFQMPAVSIVGTLVLAGALFLCVGTWEANRIIEEETND